jgi:hypothetical protein
MAVREVMEVMAEMLTEVMEVMAVREVMEVMAVREVMVLLYSKNSGIRKLIYFFNLAGY